MANRSAATSTPGVSVSARASTPMSAIAAGPRTTTDLSAVGASYSAAVAAAPAIVHISPCTSCSTDFASACPAVHTPLSVSRFESLLCNHPDSSLASYVIRCGFDIGFTGNRVTNQHSSNLSSAFQHSAFVSAQLTASCNTGYTAGQFDSPPFPFMYCFGIGTVPKKNGKLRLIHHLSSPAGSSVYDGIPAEPFSLQYSSIDKAINIIMSSRLLSISLNWMWRALFAKYLSAHRIGMSSASCGRGRTTTTVSCYLGSALARRYLMPWQPPLNG